LLLLGHLVLSPVVFGRHTLEPFEYNKVALLEFAAILAAAVLSGPGTITNLLPSIRAGWRDPATFGFVLLFASACISTMTSLSPRTSFRGAPDSDAGLCTVAAYLVLFLASRVVCRTAADARQLLSGAVVATGFVSAYALVQFAGADPARWEDVSTLAGYVRPFASMGHANFLAAYLVLTLPLTVHFAASAAHRRQWGTSAVFALLAALSLAAVAASLSRGAWLAAIAAVLVQAALRCRALVPFLRGRGLLLVPAATLLAPCLVYLHAPDATAERFRHFADLAGRRYLWRAALGIFRSHPLVGSGTDTFALAFGQKRSPAYWLVEWNSVPTKAHNAALQLLATQGLLGAAAAALFLVGLGVAARRAWQRAAALDKPFLAALFAATVGFLVQILFSFTVAGCGTLFVTLAAALSKLGGPEAARHAPRCWPSWQLVGGLLGAAAVGGLLFLLNLTIAASSWGPGPAAGCFGILAATGAAAAGVLRVLMDPAGIGNKPSGRVRPERGSAPVAPAFWAIAASGLWSQRVRQSTVIAAALALVLVGIVRPMLANWNSRRADQFAADDPRAALPFCERAVALDPGAALYWTKLGQTTRLAAEAAGDARLRWRSMEQARQAFARAAELLPADANVHFHLGSILGQLAIEGGADPAASFAEFDRALALDPFNAYILEDAGRVALALHDTRRAEGYLSRCVDLYHGFLPARAALAYVAAAEGRLAVAERMLCEVLPGDWTGDDDGRLTARGALASVLLQEHRPGDALPMAAAVLDARPGWDAVRMTYARSLEALGRRTEAAAEYRRLRSGVR
jgi:O-antigen ligase/Tfp pilus assembly protein PilF